jgi:hypothetical protein
MREGPTGQLGPPAVATEACVAWKGENPSAPLKAYVEIVEHVGRSIR